MGDGATIDYRDKGPKLWLSRYGFFPPQIKYITIFFESTKGRYVQRHPHAS